MGERGEHQPAESEVINEVEYPEQLNYELVQQWAEGIPTYEEANVLYPEWQETPTVPVDLTAEGFGEVYIKDESVNPTGTMKDRPAWEFATLYRDFARNLETKVASNSIDKNEVETINIPRLSLISAGNEGRALAEMFAKYNLPPPKILLGSETAPNVIEAIKQLRADSYKAELSSGELSAEDIKYLTRNENGTDITSLQLIQPEAVFYDWLVHEAFNQNPDEIYLPEGSGRLKENFLYWQYRTAREASQNAGDPRLQADPAKVTNMNILSATSGNMHSVADKLPAAFRPFLTFKENDLAALKNFSFTGKETSSEDIPEEWIKYAHQVMTNHGINAEPSGAAGLARYMIRYKRSEIPDGAKSLVINSGLGLV
jgi:hypothetical protein